MADGVPAKEWLDSRIMADDELPDWLAGDIEEEPDPENVQVLIDAGLRATSDRTFLTDAVLFVGGRGQRKHKEVTYVDARSERQWLKETGAMYEPGETPQAKKKRKL